MNTLIKLILFLVVVLSRTKVFSFNIETRNPIVKKGQTKDSYFGFSVAQHSVSEGSTNPNDYWILVGAPLGKNLQPNTNKSGALFKCPLSNSNSDCIQIETDGKRLEHEYGIDYDDLPPSLRQPTTLQSPGNDEIKEDQWLGVTVKSQKPGGKVVVCAHRYIQSPNINLFHYGMGLCYLLSENLEAKDALQPCKGRPTDKLHQQYGFCQVGTSLAVLNDGFAVMGAPGPYTWRGTIFANDVEKDFLVRDHTNYKGPLNDNPTPIDKYSYLGMSVTGGRFFEKGMINYVSGAPRSRFHGQVFFFNKTKSIDDLTILLILNGTQFASSFGYEILAVDIDQDGYDELLVAAPFYYGNRIGGAVYLYNNIRKCTEKCEPVANFTGKPESRFGFSMTTLGDINKDGYTDVAIGAPYESGGGAVYIYLGDKDGLQHEPSQIIKHPERYGVKTVGYSMSGGLDMDVNEYPDLLVGAYESDMVILYKTRPIIDIAIKVSGEELKNINVSKKGCKDDPGENKTCFSFTTCFTLSKFKLTERVDIKYEIKELAKIPRVTFGDQNTEDFMIVNDNTREYCQTRTAYLVEGNGDIITPIKFQVNYTIHNDAVNSPILNKTSVKTFEATFQKNCGDDDVCKSNLILTAGTLLNETSDGYIFDMGKSKELILDVDVTNKGEAAYEAKIFIEQPEGALSYIALQTEKDKTASTICTSSNDSTLVTCNLGNPFQEDQTVNLRLRFEITRTTVQKLNLNIIVNSTSEELSNQTSKSMVVILQKIASYIIKGEGKPPNIFYSGEVRGQSAMRHLEDIGPKVVHSYDVINQGDWNIRDLSVVISWPYQVFTTRSQGGKWLLYLEKTPIIIFGNQISQCSVSPREFVNPLGLSDSGKEEHVESTLNTEIPNGRRRREVEEVVKPQSLVGNDNKERKIVTMDCAKTALCANITCVIPQLPENSEIKINISARVWNSTFVEDYNNVDWVSIKSVARVLIYDPTLIHSDNSMAMASIETRAYPGTVKADTGVNIWIIIGSVLAGLLLLIVVIVILYKCGFFKRNRVKDRTLSANLKKQGESETLLEGDSKSTKR